jgi:hypothetical protein
MDSYQKQTYDAPHNSRKKTNGNNRHNHRSVTKDWLTSIGAITSDAIPKAGNNTIYTSG